MIANAYIEELQNNNERALVALEKAKQIERKLIKKNFRYVRATPNTTILIECDASGNPTQKGLKRLQIHRERFGFTKR